MERHNFNKRQQKPGETIEAYVSTLKNMARTCSFGALQDELIRDRLVCGITSDSVRRSLLKETELTLAKAVRICQISEFTDQHSKALSTPKHITSASVDAVQIKHGKFKRKTNKPLTNIQNYRNCGGSHPAKREQCPAFGKQCHICKKCNHYKKPCRSAKPHQRGKQVNQISEDTDPDSDETFCIEHLTMEGENNHKEGYCTVKVFDKALMHYDMHKTVTLTCDASQHGLGAACLHNDKPVAYAPRTLTPTERRYTQIEELLAVVFTCYRFYDYIYGKPVVIETDHQPLVTIQNKPFHTVPARLQHMMLRLQKFNLTLVYKKDKDLYVTDTLSRTPTLDEQPLKEEGRNFEVMSLQLISPRCLQELAKHTSKDTTLQTLGHYVQQGWPKQVSSVPIEIKPFFSYHEELIIDNNVIMKGNGAIVPASLHETYLQELHKGHPGMESTKRRARDSVFWLTINSDIENKVKSCSICNSLKPHQQKQPLKLHQIPHLPWSITATDIRIGQLPLPCACGFVFWMV